MADSVVSRDEALPGGRVPVLSDPRPHTVLGTSLEGPWEPGQRELIVGMGCFWGAERIFWRIDGVQATAAGYAGGWTKNPTYREVCTGRTGHAEVVRVVYDPDQVSLEALVARALENHDPTQGNRQGFDVGTQYRSVFYVHTQEELDRVRAVIDAYQRALGAAGRGRITSEVKLLRDAGDGTFYLAENEHQQYLDKNPHGYCNHGFNGVACPI